MTTPTVYASTDASAPVLQGNVGSLIALLDACLVNGYTGKPAAGWTKDFSGTNLAAYRMGTGGTARRMYLRVDDTNATLARLRGFDSMTDVNTGTEPFPTVAQSANGHTIYKSNTAAATRAWVIVATPTCFYLCIVANQTTIIQSTSTNMFFFGQYPTEHPSSFVHNVAIVGSQETNVDVNGCFMTINGPLGFSPLAGNHVCRGVINLSGAVQVGKGIDWSAMGYSGTGVAGVAHGVTWPSSLTGAVYGSRMRLIATDSGVTILGRLPGLWVPFYPSGNPVGNPMDTINGSGSLAGRTLLVLAPASAPGTGSNVNARVFLDITSLD